MQLRSADLVSDSFKYDTPKQALAAVARLYKRAAETAAMDHREREIVLIVQPEPSWELKRLLMAEIENEADGGASPATLDSALESLQSGYSPYEGFPVDAVYDELELLTEYGDGGTPAVELLTKADWKRRAQ